MSAITKKLSRESTNQQTNYNTDFPGIEEITDFIFTEQDERDTIYSLLAEMRGM